MFIDRATIRVRGGRGGDGCVSFFRARGVPRGGPDGGDGGNGGSVHLRANPQLTTLYDFDVKPLYAADDGKRGRGGNRKGRSGKDLYVHVPCGTQVWKHPRQDQMTADLVEPGQTLLLAKGGQGGLGNKSFATATYQTPREAERGEPGEEFLIDLELKLIADVGLIGLPNAGKSTLLRALSRARPRVASYPFTTLHPHVGICVIDEDRRLVVADIPGLIQGAHEGAGLGHDFLRHIERTQVLAHLIESAGGSVDQLIGAWKTIEEELSSYSPILAQKRRYLVLTKLDLIQPAQGERLVRELAARLGVTVLGISAVTRLGIQALVESLWSLKFSPE